MASAPDASAAQPAAPRTPEPQARSSSAAGGVSPSPRRSPRIAKLQLGDRPTMGLDEAGDNTSRTGLVYDEYCLQHRANYKHVEGPQRTQAIFERFFEAGLVARCRRVDAVEAPVADLQRAHDAEYVQMINDTQKETFPAPEPDSEDENDDTVYPGCRFLDGDTYVNEHSAKAARLSCGGLTELAAAVVQGELANGFAVIRPPGHHANGECASGFCLFNNVGVASRAIQARFPEIERVAIVDWDVHHGDGTQAIFDSDASVLYTSIHRYENGTFFPYTGGIDEVGSGAARGKCVNIPLPCADLGDVEYLECVEDVLVPILREFRPQLLFVSAGFDCADGDPLGGMHVTPDGFAHMTHLLMQEGVVENDRIVVALEGGYNPDAISAAAEACMHTLLGDPLPARPTKPKVGRNSRLKKKLANRARVFHTALNRVIRAQAEFWTCMQEAVDSKGLKKSPAKSEPEPQPEPQPEPEPVDNEEAELRKAMEGLTLDG